MSSAVDLLADTLRSEILEGSRPGEERLREQELARTHGAARHTVRAALRQLEAERLVRIVPNAGARVARLAREEIADLAVTRRLLEVGAVELALARGGGRLPPETHAAAASFAGLCRGTADWGAVAVAHSGFHEALVAAAGSPRLSRAHAALSAELVLFLVQGRPHFSPDALAGEHLELVRALERDGPGALEEHLARSAAALLR